MSNYFLGLDAGTTVIKAVLFDEEGRFVQEASRENEIIFLENGGAEIDLEAYWQSVAACILEVMGSSGLRGEDVKALSVSANGVTVMPVDKSGKPLRKAFSYLDKRGAKEACEIIEKFGQETFYKNMGQPHLLPMLPIVKVLWMKRNESDIFNRFHKIVMVDDYLMFKLIGVWATDSCLAGTTGFVKVSNNSRWRETMEYVGVADDNFCEVKQSGTPIGNVLASVANKLGLSQRTLVVCGALDQAAGCIGSGNIKSGILTECTGTVLALNATVDKPVINIQKPVPCFAHAVEKKFIMLPWCLSGGRTLKWFRDEFFKSNSTEAEITYSDMVTAADSIRPGSDNLLMLPHIAGANSPEFNEDARGVFFNIDIRHKRAHFVRAILESVGYMIRRNVEMLQSLEVPSDTIRSIGGAARSRTWNQIKADILQIPVTTCQIKEVGALGAAILAAVGSGYFSSIEQGCKQFVRFDETFEPDRKKAQIYDKCYHEYIELYNRVDSMFGKD